MRRAHPGEVGTLTVPTVHGSHDPAFEPVVEAFRNNFIEHGEIGASVQVTVDSRVVVDLWAGYSDPAGTRQWQKDTLVNAFSVGKGVTALVAAMCVDRGYFSYDDPVVAHWPEFGAHDKDRVTVRDLLGHRAGLPAVRRRMPEGAMLDWHAMVGALADERPWWEPGTAHGYHVNTFGFLIGEVIRRTTGSSIGTLLHAWVSGPHGIDIHLGCPDELHSRMADFEWPPMELPTSEPPGLDEAQLLQLNTYYNPSGLSGGGVVNDAAWRRAEIPSTNMHATAEGVSRLYTRLARDVPSLLAPSVLTESLLDVSHGHDMVLGRNSRFGAGWQIPIPERGFGPNPESFGHYGAGGSLGFADPVAGVGFGYVMNQMGPRWQNPRNRALVDALYACL